jgi:hypothetical protein
VAFLVALGLAAAACGSSPPSPSAGDASVAPSSIAASQTPSTGVARTTLSGTGSKRGFPVELAGRYNVTGSVKTKRGCAWSLSIQPGVGKVDSVRANGGGRHRIDVSPISVDPGAYRLTVASKGCGAWSVALSRP